MDKKTDEEDGEVLREVIRTGYLAYCEMNPNNHLLSHKEKFAGGAQILLNLFRCLGGAPGIIDLLSGRTKIVSIKSEDVKSGDKTNSINYF
ncbi:MAG TPA: hypothetical protein VFM02_03115 [Candidatus Paceibacterota bacterium]|nr:hypothetical protein [Candidatus Paceibacterota bacterium]